MPERLGDDLQICARGRREARGAVPKVVDAMGEARQKVFAAGPWERRRPVTRSMCDGTGSPAFSASS